MAVFTWKSLKIGCSFVLLQRFEIFGKNIKPYWLSFPMCYLQTEIIAKILPQLSHENFKIGCIFSASTIFKLFLD